MSRLTPDALASFRETRGDPALLGAFAVGIALSALHWGGLVVGGALVGLVAPTFRRGLLSGLYFGGTVLLAFAVYLWWFGVLARAAGMGQLTLLTVGIGLAVPTLAAGAIRGLV